MTVSRRTLLTSACALATFPGVGMAATPREIAWPDLIPPKEVAKEMIRKGILDKQNGTAEPGFDPYGPMLNPDLDGAYIKMPGFIIPIDLTSDGVTSFVLVPYAGACIHTPPPPPNQLVFVTTQTPWPEDELWEAVWVTGQMQIKSQSTAVAEIAYSLIADKVEIYEW